MQPVTPLNYKSRAGIMNCTTSESKKPGRPAHSRTPTSCPIAVGRRLPLEAKKRYPAPSLRIRPIIKYATHVTLGGRMGLFLVREILAITGITITETGTYGSGARFEIVVPKTGYRRL